MNPKNDRDRLERPGYFLILTLGMGLIGRIYKAGDAAVDNNEGWSSCKQLQESRPKHRCW